MAVLDFRLRRLECTRRDHHGVFFLAVGRDDAKIEAAIANNGKPPSRARLAGVAITSSRFAASGPVSQWSDEQLIAGILGEPVTDNANGVDHEQRADPQS
jgi:hypothetical protein